MNVEMSGNFEGAFKGVEALYKLVRFRQGKPELYEVTSTGLEMFRGYVSMKLWHRRQPCTKCGAAAGQHCQALGLVGIEGNAMEGVHANRKK